MKYIKDKGIEFRIIRINWENNFASKHPDWSYKDFNWLGEYTSETKDVQTNAKTKSNLLNLKKEDVLKFDNLGCLYWYSWQSPGLLLFNGLYKVIELVPKNFIKTGKLGSEEDFVEGVCYLLKPCLTLKYQEESKLLESAKSIFSKDKKDKKKYPNQDFFQWRLDGYLENYEERIGNLDYYIAREFGCNTGVNPKIVAKELSNRVYKNKLGFDYSQIKTRINELNIKPIEKLDPRYKISGKTSRLRPRSY